MQRIIASLDGGGGDHGHTREMTRDQRRLVRRFASRLPEPDRTIFLRQQNGMVASEISAAMKIDVHDVCRALARIHVTIGDLLK